MSSSTVKPFELPSFWENGLLKDYAEIFSGVWGDDLERCAESGFEPVRVFRVSDVKENNTLSYTKAPLRAVTRSHAMRYGLNEGDLVVVKSSGSNNRVISGRCAYFRRQESQERFIPSNFTFGLRPVRTAIDPSFLFYWLRTDQVVSRVEDLAEGSTYPNLKKAEYEKIPVPRPPLPEQQRIAQVLSTVQEAITQQERLIRTTTELKQALMQKLFTEGLRGEKLKETEIGPVPESWEVVELGRFFQIKHGYAFDGKNFRTTGDHVLMTPGHFFEEGGFRDQGDKTKYVVGDIPADYVLAKGDLVVAMTEQKAGLLGSAAFVPKDGRYLHNQRLGLITDLVIDRLNARFLFHVLNTPRFRREVAETSTGSKVRHTSPTKLRAVKVALPSTIHEQLKIADSIDATTKSIHVAERKRDVLMTLFRTLLHELMTGKVRVGETETANA